MSQGNLALPIVGVYGGLAAAQDINAAVQALLTENSGNSAPANNGASGGSPVLGQHWIDTSSSQYKNRRVYDGTSWLALGSIDVTNHLWLPPVGGGVATIASAATVDLGSTPEATITISGTTTITSFGTSAPLGVMKWLKFSGALQITYNASTMVLLTGATLTTAAGDMAAMRRTSTGWEMISYSRANGQPLANNPIVSLDNLSHLAAGQNWSGTAGQIVEFKTNFAEMFAITAGAGGTGDAVWKLSREASGDEAGLQLYIGSSLLSKIGQVGNSDVLASISKDGGASLTTFLQAFAADAAVYLPLLRYFNTKWLDLGTAVSGTVTFDRSAGQAQRVQIGGNVTLAFSNFPAAGTRGDIEIEIVNGNSSTLTWPAAMRFIKADGTTSTTPFRTLQTTGSDFMKVWSRDGGTTIYAYLYGDGSAPLTSPGFLGTPTAPTPGTSDSSTRIATTQYVQNVVGIGAGGLNAYALMTNNSGVDFGQGANIAGGNLRFASMVISSGGSAGIGVGGTPSGTWQCMSYNLFKSQNSMALAQRVA